MKDQSCVPRLTRILGAISGIVGVLMIGLSFSINPGPPPNATIAQIITFGNRYYSSILWGAWLQAAGPVFIVLFAFTLVHLAEAHNRISGWMTFFGAMVLIAVSMIEITFYIAAVFGSPADSITVSMRAIYAVQHLYFIVAAPAFFIPLGIVLTRSDVLPKAFGYLAVLLGLAFTTLGIVFLQVLVLPMWVTAFAGVQAIWWLAAAITLLVKTTADKQEHRQQTSDIE
ncbi:MAG: hypothetical protein JST32_14855 [Bacteroidetes bacterium]|nr:hypothetical protein [Bacteroidota bacterium]